MRKLLFLFSLVLAIAFGALAADTLTLSDGGTVTGEIIKIDDNGLMVRLPGEAYAATNVPWGKLSQDSLKQLSQNPKLNAKRPTAASLAEPFIEPDASQRPAKPEITVNPVTRLNRPENPSLFGGLAGSPVGLFIFVILYLANLYAGYEVAIVRARPALQVIGLAAVLPLIGPVIFLAMPMKVEAPPEAPAEPGHIPGQKTPEEIQIVEASWRAEEKKPEVLVFARGKFTFNKRFVETKFAGFLGVPKGDALKFTMEVKTAQKQFAVARILQVAVADVAFETVPAGQVSVPLADILEIKLTPIPEAPVTA